MLRHSAFFMLREETTPDQVLVMLKGLAYMRFACPSVVALDFGADLFGGSTTLREVKPWKRAPRWRSRLVGPPADYDVALHLDFDDQAGLDAYNDDDVHHEVGVYNASICRGELTARVDWWYDGAPLITHDHVRHSAMFVWSEEADDEARAAAVAGVRELESAPGVEQVVVGENVGTLTTDFDWVVDVRLADAAAAEQLLASEAYARAMKQAGAVSQHEWTARMTHRMHGL